MYHLALVSKKLIRLGRPFLNPLNTRTEFDWTRNIPQQKNTNPTSKDWCV